MQRLFKEKSSGTIILLRREPGNKHDENAVAVYAALTRFGSRGSYEWTKVGYVAKEDNHEFYGLPLDTILEGAKYGQDSFQLSGKIRQYK